MEELQNKLHLGFFYGINFLPAPLRYRTIQESKTGRKGKKISQPTVLFLLQGINKFLSDNTLLS